MSQCRACTATTLCAGCAALLARSVGYAPSKPHEESERSFQGRVVRAARDLGYRTYHTADARGSDKGWFDVALARAGDKLVLAELKKAGEKPTKEQANWYQDLQRIEHVEAYLWYPRDYDDIVTILARKAR